MKYYLAKTEPSSYSIDTFAEEKETIWDGVHNYQAIAVIKTMKVGDRVFIYHSVKQKQIVGEAEVTDLPFLNTADVRHSWAVKMKFIRKFVGPTLAMCKTEPMCKDFKLVTHTRLSTMPVPSEVANWINAF